MTTAHKPRKMTITDYETLKAKKNKTDQDYMRINFFEEKFYNAPETPDRIRRLYRIP